MLHETMEKQKKERRKKILVGGMGQTPELTEDGQSKQKSSDKQKLQSAHCSKCPLDGSTAQTTSRTSNHQTEDSPVKQDTVPPNQTIMKKVRYQDTDQPLTPPE
jgi:hypothetical protein